VKYHCFLSYTGRDREVRELAPLLDAVVGAFRSLGIVQAPVFWDRFEMGREADAASVARAISEGAKQSVCMIAFVTPSYLTSKWCLYEWGCMAGAHLDRGPEWPVILPFITKPLGDDGQFVLQTPSLLAAEIDWRALGRYALHPQKTQHALDDRPYRTARKSLDLLIGHAVGFIAEKCAQMHDRPDLLDLSAELAPVADDLKQGWSLEAAVLNHAHEFPRAS
jgi:hypothetical protein